MRPIISFVRTPNSKGSGLVAEPCAPFVPISTPHAIAIDCPARVLSVGRMDEDVLIREPLDQWPGFSFFHANDYRELWILSRRSSYDAVIFHNSLGYFELGEGARLVRRRWPSANIVLVRSGEIMLEDPLYDQRLKPPVNANILLSALSQPAHHTSEKHRPRWRVAHALGN
jgi:hypothetical protein